MSFGRNRSKVTNVVFDLLEDVEFLHAKFALFYKSSRGYKKFPWNLEEDFCAFFRGDQNITALSLDIFFPMLKLFSNLNTTCPIQRGTYMLKDAEVETVTIKNGAIPSGDYRFHFEWISASPSGPKRILEVQFFISVPQQVEEV